LQDPRETSSVLDDPLVSFGRDICGDLDAGLRREWLGTNGLGGYASGTLSGIATRRYHGLLVAALDPPVGRTTMVAGMIERARYDDDEFALSTEEFGGGTVDGHGYVNLESFGLEGTFPVWNYALADALLQKRIWMAHGANSTYVSYHHIRGSNPIELTLKPLVTYRSFHSLGVDGGWQPQPNPKAIGDGIAMTVAGGDGRATLRILADAGEFRGDPAWYWNFLHREEAARGLDTSSDLLVPGSVVVTLRPGEQVCLVLTTEEEDPDAARNSLDAERGRQHELLALANATAAPAVIQQLVLAADQFVVSRYEDGKSAGTSIIAGYHWFNDWGRDTMISLPGLTLATGRSDDAAAILETFARYIADGLLPNNFPDTSGAIPGYNTVDATLWYFIAVRACYLQTGDEAWIGRLLPALQDIVRHHQAGTRYGIGVDPADGLLRSGESGVQLTWMDAKVGEWVVTPRIGKPVEINALWYNALMIMSELLVSHNQVASAAYAADAEQVHSSFTHRFVDLDRAWLADVVDGPEGDDWAIRPNQLFAVSLPFPLVEGSTARTVIEAAGRHLWTSLGPRSLSPHHPMYRGTYGGDQVQRDGGYHQGPVWSWLTGAWIEGYLRAFDDREGARQMLAPVIHHLSDAGLGSISEILDGDPPHVPRGCIAQAWSVGEVLRAWRMLAE
jgi:predicted glycogen debranching enzyme